MNLMKQIIAVLTIALLYGITAHAQSPREQLNQMAQQLQKNPSDNALREKIIKLALTIKPAPMVPEEANRHLARGAAAIKVAKSETDFKEAMAEFEKAIQLAPWLGNAYYNLAVVQDKANQPAVAIRNLKFYLLAAPSSMEAQEAKNLIYELEYKQEKLAADEAKYSWLLGSWTIRTRFSNGTEVSTNRDQSSQRSGNQFIFGKNLRATIQESGSLLWEHSHTADDWPCPKERGWVPTTVSISADRHKISYVFSISNTNTCAGLGQSFSVDWIRQ